MLCSTGARPSGVATPVEPGKIKMTPRSHIFQKGALCLASLRCVSQTELDPSAWICSLSNTQVRYAWLLDAFGPCQYCSAHFWVAVVASNHALRLVWFLPSQTIVIARAHTHTPAETTQHKFSRSLSSEPACLARESQLQRRFSHLWLPRKREILILVNASL